MNYLERTSKGRTQNEMRHPFCELTCNQTTINFLELQNYYIFASAESNPIALLQAAN